ncbi:hypothetical protein GH741_05175 [Aquibacillus halophilus]|uniref:Uncharacterized protein n=1 Tax=Aquibacillus halophilus TaxID=930132 RepID=A0A6A8D8I1_9BACI|nr:hypothetical protein [Aquibacillus halophilus]MRH42065.1 hypothetical protein [Aquibacillus halophilus]
MEFSMGQSYQRLNEASQSMLELVSEYIGTNTFCVTQTTDEQHSILTHVFNRNTVLFDAGDTLFLEDAY